MDLGKFPTSNGLRGAAHPIHLRQPTVDARHVRVVLCLSTFKLPQPASLTFFPFLHPSSHPLSPPLSLSTPPKHLYIDIMSALLVNSQKGHIKASDRIPAIARPFVSERAKKTLDLVCSPILNSPSYPPLSVNSLLSNPSRSARSRNSSKRNASPPMKSTSAKLARPPRSASRRIPASSRT